MGESRRCKRTFQVSCHRFSGGHSVRRTGCYATYADHAIFADNGQATPTFEAVAVAGRSLGLLGRFIGGESAHRKVKQGAGLASTKRWREAITRTLLHQSWKNLLSSSAAAGRLGLGSCRLEWPLGPTEPSGAHHPLTRSPRRGYLPTAWALWRQAADELGEALQLVGGMMFPGCDHCRHSVDAMAESWGSDEGRFDTRSGVGKFYTCDQGGALCNKVGWSSYCSIWQTKFWHGACL